MLNEKKNQDSRSNKLIKDAVRVIRKKIWSALAKVPTSHSKLKAKNGQEKDF